MPNNNNKLVNIIWGANKNHILVSYTTDSNTNKNILAKRRLNLFAETQPEKVLNKLLTL